MIDGIHLSARSVAGLLARIFGPSSYDVPPKGGDPFHLSPVHAVSARSALPLSWAMLNPQPLPPRERYALALADAHIQELHSLDRAAFLMGGKVADRAIGRSLQLVAAIDELCPRWPTWPKSWPPPPPPPPWLDDEMQPTELFLFGTRVLAGAEQVDAGQLQESMAALAERTLELSMRG